MARRTAGILALLAMVALAVSCARIYTPPPPSAASLPDEPVPVGNVVPAEWGTLVQVSSTDVFPDLLQLWFQDKDGNLRMLVLDVTTHRFTGAKLIRRK
jgi:hypothetical protein